MNKIKTYITKYTPELKEKILAAWGNSGNLPPVQKVDKINQIVEEFGVGKKSLICFLTLEKVYTAIGGDPVEDSGGSLGSNRAEAIEQALEAFERHFSFLEKALDSLLADIKQRDHDLEERIKKLEQQHVKKS
ncbi:MAG: hypothetical protein R3C11_30100 [Planctomycetaceae bacterium]